MDVMGKTRATKVVFIGALTGGLLLQAPSVDGHAYLMEPVSRNFYYTAPFQGQ